MNQHSTKELIQAFTDVSGNYENVHLAISANDLPSQISSNFLAHIYHTHPYYEFFYVMDEGLTLVSPDMANVSLHPGDVCIVPPFCEHFTTSVSSEKKRISSVALVTGFIFYDNRLNTLRNFYKRLRMRFENGGAPLIIRKDEIDSDAVFSAIKSFRKNAAAERSRAAFLDYCHALELLAEGGSAEKLPYTKNDIIAKVANFVSCYYMYDIKLTELAECFFISAHTLNRLIFEYYNDTFHNLLTQRRMQNAALYLTNTNETVASIAEQVGYSSLSSFYTAFKRYSGMLPAEYREKKMEEKKKEEK